MSAPGKVLLAGEYAVLRGTPALVAAVSRRVVGHVSAGASDGSPPRAAGSRDSAHFSPEIRLALARAEAIRNHRLGGPIGMNRAALDHPSGTKLGLGSSAAQAVAAAALVFADAGDDLGSPDIRARVLRAALDGHRAVAPDGSGVDVVVSTHGGVLRVERTEDVPVHQDADVPDGLEVSVVWTGVPVRTSGFVSAVFELEARDPATFAETMGAVDAAARAFVDAWCGDDAAAVVRATAPHAEALRALGDAAGVPIVEARLARLAVLAAEHGGAAKPSGAGGGDVAVAFFTSRDARSAFERAARAESFEPLALTVGDDGVRRELAWGGTLS
ncbi:MAG: hypothetical protein KC417_07260 [Myxococcales bacterium]|nr:hypothetical protein [Myxococcales bacterium]